MKKTLLTIIAMSLASVSAFAADVNGKWKADFDTPVGQMHYIYDLHADGANLTGTAKSDQGQTELKQGKVDGDNVSFVEVLSFDGNTINITYTGKLDGDQIKFARHIGDFGDDNIVATRVK